MSANLPSDAAEKNLSDNSRSNSSDSVATGASSDHEQERESSKSPAPISSRSGSKSPLSNLQTIPEYQLLQVSPSPPPGDGAEAVGQQNQRPRSATGQQSIQQEQQNNAIDDQEPPEPPVNAALEPEILVQNVDNQSDSDRQSDSDDGTVTDEDPLLEVDGQHRRQCQFTFTLIRPFATNHWSCCRSLYTVMILVFIIALLAALTCMTFWAVEMSKIKDRTITVSTHEVSKLSGLTIPHDHLYSEGLCINVPDGLASPNHGTEVNLVAIECDNVISWNDTYNITQPEDRCHTPVPYVFYLLAGSQIKVNLQFSSGKVEVFLLIEEEVFEQCIFGNIPEEQLRINETEWNGSLHTWDISSANHYYLCFCTCEANNTSYSYSLEIDPLVKFYLTGRILHNVTYNDLGQKNCLSYANIFSELHNETCIFVETSMDTDEPHLVGYFELTVSSQKRLEILWYSLGLLAVTAMIVVVLALLCVATWHKVRNPDLPGCRHTCNYQCNCQLYPEQD